MKPLDRSREATCGSRETPTASESKGKREAPIGLRRCKCNNCGAPNQNTRCKYCGEMVPG